MLVKIATFYCAILEMFEKVHSKINVQVNKRQKSTFQSAI